MATLKEIFDRQFEGVVFDRKFCLRVIQFSNRFMTKNPDHTEFFGGVLLGVNPVTFTEYDRDAWYNEVLTIDEGALRDDFTRNASAVNMDFNVMSEPFNYTSLYICHRLKKENSIPMKLRADAQVHAIMVLHYSYLTSLMYHRFGKYQANREVAQAAYNGLSMKYDIRRYGSWRDMLEARGEEIAFKSPIYRKAVVDFNPDKQVIYTVTTTQGRIRKMINNLYGEYIDTLNSGTRVKSQNATMVTTDGETILRDRTNGYGRYRRYLNEVALDSRGFIKDELVTVTLGAVKNATEEVFRKSLTYLTENIGKPKQGYLEELLDTTLTYLFNYLTSQRSVLRRNDLSTIISKVKMQLMASRTSDPMVLKIREWGDRLVKSAHHTRTPTVVTSTRTAILLYLVLRAITMSHYN